MTWQVTWSLILGFTLSAVIETLVRKSMIAGLLPDDRRSKSASSSTSPICQGYLNGDPLLN